MFEFEFPTGTGAAQRAARQIASTSPGKLAGFEIFSVRAKTIDHVLL